MGFNVKDWKDYPDTSTPITQAALEDMETRLSGYTDTKVGALVYNVKDYGATGNGSTDDSTAIQSAVTACGNAGGGVVYVPPGTYKVGTVITIADYVNVVGAGGSNTIVRQAGNNFAFKFDPGNMGRVADMMIYPLTTQTSGGAIAFGNRAYNIRVERVWFEKGTYCSINMDTTLLLELDPAAGPYYHSVYWFSDLRWNGIENCHTAFKFGNSTTGVITDVYIDRCSGYAATANDMQYWIDARSQGGLDTLKIHESIFVLGQNGIVLGNDNEFNSRPTNTKIVDLTIDGLANIGVDIRGCYECELTSCEISACGSTSTPALRIGANAQLFRFNGGCVQNSPGDAVHIASGSAGTLIQGAAIVDNNASNTAFKDGITAFSGAQHWTVTNCMFGNGLRLAVPGHQMYPIEVGENCDYFQITNNHFIGHDTADQVANASTKLHYVFRDNLPITAVTIASASTLTLNTTEPYQVISGSTTITSITASYAGRTVTLQFNSTAQMTNGSNLKLNGDFTGTADRTITLVCDGTTWFEVARSAN